MSDVPSPYELHLQANGDSAEYVRLMERHGHLVRRSTAGTAPEDKLPLCESEEDRAAFMAAAKGTDTACCRHPLSSHDVNPHDGEWFCEEYCCSCSTSPVAPDVERRVRSKVAAEIEREFGKACYAAPELKDYRAAGLNTAASVRGTADHLNGSEPDASL